MPLPDASPLPPPVVFLPLPEAERTVPALARLTGEMAERLGEPGAAHYLDPLLPGFLRQSLHFLKASEGTLWLADMAEETLIPVFNSGPQAERFLAQIRQPLSRGIISMVYVSGQACSEAEVRKNGRHDPETDRRMECRTLSMMAAPVAFAGRVRGVLSAVRLESGAEGRGNNPAAAAPFTADDLVDFQVSAAVVGRLMDLRLMEAALSL